MGQSKAGPDIAVILVHGTNDTATEASGDKWFQAGSTFRTAIERQLADRGVEATFFPHLWSGRNSASGREQASHELARKIRKLGKQHASVHVVGHSHGGNVANDAACLLDWSQKKTTAGLASVVTVGTPFFRTTVTRAERFGAWSFLMMLALSVAMTIVTLLATVQVSALRETAPVEEIQLPTRHVNGVEKVLTESEREEWRTRIRASRQRDLEQVDLYTRIVQISLAANAAFLFFVFPLARKGVKRIRRATRRRDGETRILSIWHPQDEAIAFLRNLETLNLEPFPRWSLLQGARTGAIVWGVRAAIAVPIIGFVLLAVALIQEQFFGVDRAYFHFLGIDRLLQPSMRGQGAWLIFGGIAAAPIVFTTIYILYRVLAAALLEFTLRGRLNRAMGNSLKGMAMGRDSDIRIGEVSTCSHNYATEAVVLDGDIASRMTAASAEATTRLLEQYRGALFSVEAANTNVLGSMAEDAMTWKSLVHTIYFDQPETAALIAAHIFRECVEARPRAGGWRSPQYNPPSPSS